MARKLVEDTVVPKNTGKAFTLRKGQRIRIIGEPGSIVDFVVFNLDNLKERFDQARTKLHQNKLFLSTGDKLLSKFFNPTMTIVKDTYKEGTHDLECGMCSGEGYQRLYKNQACPELQIQSFKLGKSTSLITGVGRTRLKLLKRGISLRKIFPARLTYFKLWK